MNNVLEFSIPFIPMNWNEYINAERSNKFFASSIKKKEKVLIKQYVNVVYKGDYPIEIIFKPHFSHKRSDLDGFRYKGILDGFVNAGVIKNDNLNCIQKITLEPIFDDEKKVDIIIKKI